MASPTLRNVLVSQLTPGKTGLDDQAAHGVSGLLLGDGWIITHGSLLSPNFFEELESRGIRDFLSAAQSELERDVLAVPHRVAGTLSFRAQYKEPSADESSSSAERIVTEECSLRLAWRCPLLRRTFNDSLFSWSFEKFAKFDKSVLSIFLLLKMGESSESRADDAIEGKRVLNEFYQKNFATARGPELMRGASIEIESTPFGNATFLESVSRGIVSNILGTENCILLTDANTVPGCEGAPVYLFDEKSPFEPRRICGLVIASLSWCRGEWVDYTFAANLQSCLGKILGLPDRLHIGDALTRRRVGSSILPDVLEKSVVVVKCGTGWGTGIVVDVPTGTIITCSHVVREIPGSRIRIDLGEKDEWARLVYRTRDGQPFDVAVLRLEKRQDNLKALRLASEIPEKGSSVLTVGYPFFPSSSAASYSRGVVSRTTSSMIQTTCCVQSGASGGPVVCRTTGSMLGLIVSNAVCHTGSASANTVFYPRFNMAVPATVLRGPIIRYLETGDARCLESLCSSDPTVQETWNFYLTLRSKM